MSVRRGARARRDPEGSPQLYAGTAGEALREARVIAGVDEAGYGPLLGPLTIGWSAFRVEDDGVDLWRELDAVVSREPRHEAERLVVADSKIVFERHPRGEARLERTVLAFLALTEPARRWPASGADLVARLRCGLALDVALESEAWFVRLPERLPRSASADEVARHAERLDAQMRRAGIDLADVGARVLGVAELNASFAETGSKGRTHWDKSAPVFRRLWRHHATAGLALVVDRHGGRKRYGALLAESFEDARVSTLSEEPARSEYTVVERDAGRSMRVAFAEKADGSSFAVALASCIAKYARETCMHAFNAHWCALAPELRPTAGYSEDGRRWLTDARAAIEGAQIQPHDLVRDR
jgi:hypothetical protein